MLSTTLPIHLSLPLVASVLFATGLILVKQAAKDGASPWSITVVTNLWAALIFPALWRFGDDEVPWSLLYQPAIIGMLYIGGQIFTFWAVERGDVSIAAPVLSTKVIMVAVFVTTIARQPLPGATWAAAAIATLGVALIQRSGGSTRHERVLYSVVSALVAATDFALFDVLVQRWAPAWGAGRFLPLVFGLAGLITLAMLPFVRLKFARGTSNRYLLLGGLLIALQSMCITLAVARYGDATRVNIVYALRGIWGVLAAWMIARWSDGQSSLHAPGTMRQRLVGACLLMAAVVLAITADRH